MYDANQPKVIYDYATILTQGLRALPTDAGTRVKLFLTEYLGSSAKPVPFGGRDQDFAQLDDWLQGEQQPPYLLLAAPAGRGKSALLLRWSLRFVPRPDISVVYFPVSIRFRTNLASVAFPALVALLATLHKENVPNDPNLSEEVWHKLLIDYLRRPLPKKQTLLLILDGIDEAADWSANPDLFPLDPPQGLRVIVSARSLANDQGTETWLQRLNWSQSGLATTVDLSPLNQLGVANVLQQMGFPLDILGDHIHIVSELYRLSEGDPLLVRLYVDELWAQGEASLRLQPEALQSIQPGLGGYFERWWSEQRTLWHTQHIHNEALTQNLLHLLAGALGPLTLDDLLSLLGDTFTGHAQDLAHHLRPLARFVTGDGIHQGYVFSHPRLGTYFLEECMNAEQRQEVEQRFLHWGQQTLIALNTETLAPEQASSYIVHYYGAHLERTQAEAPALLALVSNGWRRAWEKRDRANAGFLGDVTRAWQVAKRENLQACLQASQIIYLGGELRCLLSQCSVNSMTSSIPPTLMLAAVKTGVWTVAQGLASLRLIPDLVPRALELVTLAASIAEPQRSDILQEALDTVLDVPDTYVRLDALVAIAPGLTEPLLWQVLELVPDIEDEADRAGILLEMAPALASYPRLLNRALAIVEAIEEDEYQALALTGLLPYLHEIAYERVLSLSTAFHDERAQAQVLLALVSQNPPEATVLCILQIAHALYDGLSRLRLLSALLGALPASKQMETQQEIWQELQAIVDSDYRVEIMLQLVSYLTEDQMNQVLEEVELLWDETQRAQALLELYPRLPDSRLSHMVQIALHFKSEELRVQLLLYLTPRLTEKQIDHLLSHISAIWDERWRVELLAQFAPSISEASRPHFQQCIETIHDPGYRAWLVAEIPDIGELPGFDLLSLFHSMYAGDERLQTLLAITPQLTQEAQDRLFDVVLPQVFHMNWHSTNKQFAHILSKLGPYLPKQWLPRTLQLVRFMSNPLHQTQILTALAPRISHGFLQETLDIVRTIANREQRTRIVEALASSLPVEQQSERIQELVQLLQIIKDEHIRLQLFTLYTRSLSQTSLNQHYMQISLTALQHIRHPLYQCMILKVLLPLWPQESLVDLLSTIKGMLEQPEQSEMMVEEVAELLQAFAPLMTAQHFPELLLVANKIQRPHWRALVLTNILTYTPETLVIELFQQLQTSTDDEERTFLLGILAPHIPQRFFLELWQASQDIKEPGKRVQIMGSLALRMPTEFFAHFWKAVQDLADSGRQIWILRILGPYMKETLFDQLLQATLKMRDKEKRTSFLLVLAQHVPEHFFTHLWQAVRDLPEERQRRPVLEALAGHVPEELFLTFFEFAEHYKDSFTRMQMLDVLLNHVPEHHFLHVWQRISSWDDRPRWLNILVPYIPSHHFSSIWESLQMDKHTVHLFTVNIPLPMLAQHISAQQIIDLLDDISSAQQRIAFVEALAPHLTTDNATALLDLLMPQQEPRAIIKEIDGQLRPLQGLVALASRITPTKMINLYPTLLHLVQGVKNEVDQVWLLENLARNTPQESLPHLLKTIWSLQSSTARTQVLKELLPTLTETTWQQILEPLLHNPQKSAAREQLLSILSTASTAIENCPRSVLYPALGEIFHMLALQTRSECVKELAHLAPHLLRLGDQQVLLETAFATLEVGNWWP